MTRQGHADALARAACEVRPSYVSASAACSRYFMLVEGLSVAGSHPMDPDDVIKGTRTSTDKETLLEMLDIGNALHKAGVVEGELAWHLLRVEFTRPDLPIGGPARGRNKLSELRREYPRAASLNESEYLSRLAEVMRRVRAELEYRRWIPTRPTSQRTQQSHPNPSSVSGRS